MERTFLPPLKTVSREIAEERSKIYERLHHGQASHKMVFVPKPRKLIGLTVLVQKKKKKKSSQKVHAEKTASKDTLRQPPKKNKRASAKCSEGTKGVRPNQKKTVVASERHEKSPTQGFKPRPSIDATEEEPSAEEAVQQHVDPAEPSDSDVDQGRVSAESTESSSAPEETHPPANSGAGEPSTAITSRPATSQEVPKGNSVDAQEPIPQKDGPQQVEPQPGKSQQEPQQVEPEQEEPQQVEPEQVEPTQVEPQQVGPQQVEPGQVEPGQVEPGQVEPAQVEPAQVEPQQVEPQQESQQGKSQQDEPHEPQPPSPPQLQEDEITIREKGRYAIITKGEYKAVLPKEQAKFRDVVERTIAQAIRQSKKHEKSEKASSSSSEARTPAQEIIAIGINSVGLSKQHVNRLERLRNENEEKFDAINSRLRQIVMQQILLEKMARGKPT